jgi:hypothetical protein
MALASGGVSAGTIAVRPGLGGGIKRTGLMAA